jgi:acetoin utilization protein AcuB
MVMKKYKKIPCVGSVMTPFPYFADADDGILSVKGLMEEHHVGHVPVQQDGRVVGMISQGELHHLIDRFLSKADKTRIRARDIMLEPYVVAFETPLKKVAVDMAKRHVGPAIVLHHGKLAGILSTTDICRILVDLLESEFSPSPDDDTA